MPSVHQVSAERVRGGAAAALQAGARLPNHVLPKHAPGVRRLPRTLELQLPSAVVFCVHLSNAGGCAISELPCMWTGTSSLTYTVIYTADWQSSMMSLEPSPHTTQFAHKGVDRHVEFYVNDAREMRMIRWKRAGVWLFLNEGRS